MGIVIHRKPHPSGWRRWFTYEGRDFAVTEGGPGWGYTIMDIETMSDAADSLFTLHEVRDAAAEACASWWQGYQAHVMAQAVTCPCCSGPKDRQYIVCGPCDDAGCDPRSQPWCRKGSAQSQG